METPILLTAIDAWKTTKPVLSYSVDLRYKLTTRKHLTTLQASRIPVAAARLHLSKHLSLVLQERIRCMFVGMIGGSAIRFTRIRLTDARDLIQYKCVSFTLIATAAFRLVET